MPARKKAHLRRKAGKASEAGAGNSMESAKTVVQPILAFDTKEN